MKEPTYTGPFDGARPNAQPIQKLDLNPDPLVHSIFPTIQGEGPFCGQRCVFVRLAGCNLQCPFCDTEYLRGATIMRVAEVVKAVKAASKAKLVVITGGEPFRQPNAFADLVWALCDDGYSVQVETNGALPVPQKVMDLVNISCNPQHRPGLYIVCSPKTSTIQPSVAHLASCLKYVAAADDIDPLDGLPNVALGNPVKTRLARPPAGWYRPIYLQPADVQCRDTNARNTRAVVDYAQQHGYIVQVQVHKILNVK